jgi:hypothetical protein
MVDDKQNKMRESLRLMSLEPSSYTISIFGVQAIFAVMQGVIMGAGTSFNDAMFPVETTSYGMHFGVVIIFYGLASVPFCMAISTFFSNSKVAN